MFSDFPEQCMALGSGRRFLQDATDRICTPSSYVLVHPATVCVDSVMQLIIEELDSRNRQISELDVGEMNAADLPKSFCAVSNLNLQGSDRRSIDKMQDQLRNVDVVLLFGFQHLDRADKRRWIKFINQWSSNVKQRIDQGDHATVLVAAMQLEPAMLDSLSIDTTLHVAWWWGIPSLLELQLVCRGDGDSGETAIEAQWKEHLAVALASGDLQFLETIWPSLTSSIPDLIGLMNDYAQQRRWTADSIQHTFQGRLNGYARGKPSYLWRADGETLSVEPPRHLKAAWADGLLYFSPEYGCELHVAAACLLDDRLARGRLWRAQLGLLSPQLDLARSMMCQELTRQLGDDWPVRYDRPNDERELAEVTADPHCCQLGYLTHLLQKHGTYQSVNPAFRILAQRASDLRNDLSHLRPVDFARYRAFHEAFCDAVD